MSPYESVAGEGVAMLEPRSSYLAGVGLTGRRQMGMPGGLYLGMTHQIGKELWTWQPLAASPDEATQGVRFVAEAMGPMSSGSKLVDRFLTGFTIESLVEPAVVDVTTATFHGMTSTVMKYGTLSKWEQLQMISQLVGMPFIWGGP